MVHGLEFSPITCATEMIEEVPSFRVTDRVSLLLTLLGKKPAWFTAVSWEPALGDFFAALGMHHCKSDLAESNHALVFVSPEAHYAHQLRDAITTTPVDHAKAGRWLGYPHTAITAYCTQQLLSSPETEKDVLKRLLSPQDFLVTAAFAPMRFSAAHWQEELAFVFHLAETVRSHSPSLYDIALHQARVQFGA